jgi:hypothetical protein
VSFVKRAAAQTEALIASSTAAVGTLPRAA